MQTCAFARMWGKFVCKFLSHFWWRWAKCSVFCSAVAGIQWKHRLLSTDYSGKAIILYWMWGQNLA